MSQTKRCAIIGAGASGIAAIKCCLEYGLQPVCFEKTHDIGGLWRYKPNECEGEASVMESTIINTSKEMMAYSDFPPPKEYPNFIHNTQVIEYFRAYIDKFNLLDYIRFNTVVTSVKQHHTYDDSGRWTLEIADFTNNNNETSTETFDAVFLCTGHHAEPYSPVFKGQEHFKGRIVHSHSYKEPREFERKNVVVVGIGNSGGDIATELSNVASKHAAKVYLSTRSGCWVNTKIAELGFPYDTLYISRFGAFITQYLVELNHRITSFRANLRFNHRLYGLQPSFKTYQQHVFLNDDLPLRLVQGILTIKPNIREFAANGHSIIFVDGTRVDNVDVVILATGYSFGFPMLADQSLIPVENNRVSLYKFIFPPDFAHPTLATIGLVQPIGALMPISEMQCRVVCDVLAGHSQLPPRALMWKDIERKRALMESRYVTSRRHTIQVYYVYYMDELANMIGAKKSMWKMLVTDPVCAVILFMGPATPYQFRLVGPHAWPAARDTIMNVWHRISYPLDPPRRRLEEARRCNMRPLQRRWDEAKVWMRWGLCGIAVLIHYGVLILVFSILGVDMFG